MKNIVGQTATGNNFFPRPRVINRIYRRLETGANVFMAAPRRVGKTSIMLHLQDEPRLNFDFIYVLTQSVNTSEEFFKRLLTETLKSTAISKLVQRSTSTKSLIKEITEKIDSIELLGIKMEFNDKYKGKLF